LKWKDSEMTPICVTCLYLMQGGVDKLRCVAFPDGIPDAILDGSHDHREEFPGDQGIRYTVADVPNAPEEQRAILADDNDVKALREAVE